MGLFPSLNERPMPTHRLSLFSPLPLIALLVICPGLTQAKAKSGNPEACKSGASQTPVNDFPTQARVESVSQCMAEHGGTNLDNMYHCVCAIDKIAAQMNFQDYSEALTYTYMFDTPGDKGGEFRDPPRSKELRDRLKKARKEAESCFPAPAPAPANPEGQK